MHQTARRRKLYWVLLGLGLLVAGAAGLWAHRMERREQAQLMDIDRLLAPQRASFRAEKDREMKGELSPLARVDYIHLPKGEAVVGAAALPLPGGASLGDVRLVVGGGTLTLRANPAVKVGDVAKEQAELKNGDVLSLGRARLLVAGLPDDPSVAVYDLAAPGKAAYRGLHYYGDDSRYSTVGKLERYARPRPVMVEASRGGPQKMQAVGVVRFGLRGEPCELEAYGSGPAMLFLVFKDPTNGKAEGSYGAGRFLYGRVWPGDQVLLDFNQAWNPLCAYSNYFHCPLPPRRNWLQVAVPVGERNYGAH